MRTVFSTKVLFTLLLALLSATFTNGQDIQVVLGPDEIGQNQAWTITISVQNERLKSIDNFPEIDGFSKAGQSTSSQTSIINGQISSTQSIIMSYYPLRQGTITVPPFKMKVNDKVISSSGKKVKVGPPVTQQRNVDPFRSFFERDNVFGAPPNEFIDIKEADTDKIIQFIFARQRKLREKGLI